MSKATYKFDADKITTGNLIATAFSAVVSLLITNCLSLVITVCMCGADYTQISDIFDSIAYVDRNTVIIFAVTTVIFLDLSGYLASIVLKKAVSHKYIGGSKAVSYCFIVVCLLLFGTAFTLCFIIKWRLRNTLFSVEDINIVDNAIKNAVETVAAPLNISEQKIIDSVGLLSCFLPLLTTVLSGLSVMYLHDEVKSEKASLTLKKVFLTYRRNKTLSTLARVKADIQPVFVMFEKYKKAVDGEIDRYKMFIESLNREKKKAILAVYSAGTIIYKEDQNAVTLLSDKSKDAISKIDDIEPVTVSLDELTADDKREYATSLEEINNALNPSVAGRPDNVIPFPSSGKENAETVPLPPPNTEYPAEEAYDTDSKATTANAVPIPEYDHHNEKVEAVAPWMTDSAESC